MFRSDAFSDKTSSTLPIIISFSSHTKTRKVGKIVDFLQSRPDCRKYITKGPNFIADGKNEFRLYYVDSSLYTDTKSLKRLNVEKEEIIFNSSSFNSIENSSISIKKEERKVRKISCNHSENEKFNNATICFRTGCDVKNNFDKQIQISYMKIPQKNDKGTMCYQLSFHMENEEIPVKSSKFTQNSVKMDYHNTKFVQKISKSFQIGSDLRFNILYVDAKTQMGPSEFKKTNIVQTNMNKTTESVYKISECSSVKFRLRKSPSFSCNRKRMDSFREFYTKMKEKCVRCGDKSRRGSIKFTIKKRPSYVHNYFFQVSRTTTRRSNSGIFEENFLNFSKYDNKRLDYEKLFKALLKNNHFPINQNEYSNKENSWNNHKLDERQMKRIDTMEYLPIEYKTRNIHDHYHEFKSKRDGIKCLFEYPDMDYFMKRSHYAILRKYHKKIKKLKHKHHTCHHHHHHKERKAKKFIDMKPKKYDPMKRNRFYKNDYDMRTKTTISGFLESFKPWHWLDNSKLSICINEECFTEEN